MDDMISRQAAIRTIADTECEYDISPYIKDERTEEQKRKDWFDMCKVLFRQIIEDLPSTKPEHLVKESGNLVKGLVNDCISRQAAIGAAIDAADDWDGGYNLSRADMIEKAIKNLPSVQPETEKYEYHYDHTDCIWYRPEARNRCPVTCAQYRDGWNDAMNYIFRDGKGYRPYRRDEQYGE